MDDPIDGLRTEDVGSVIDDCDCPVYVSEVFSNFTNQLPVVQLRVINFDWRAILHPWK